MSTLELTLVSIALIVLVTLSGYFSAVDMAYSSVNTLRLQKRGESGDKLSALASRYADDYDVTIASVLFGNDLTNILATSLATNLGIDLFGKPTGGTIGSAIIFAFILIFGEILPKAVARPSSFAVSTHLARSVGFFRVIFFPIVYPTTAFANWITKPLLKSGNDDRLASEDELQEMVNQIQSEGIIDASQSNLLHKSIDFQGTSAYEIMTPRVNVFAYDIDIPIEKFCQNPSAFKHSRIPVYKDNLDNVLGFISVKQLLRTLLKGEKPNIDKLLTPIISVPRTMPVSSIMNLMKQSHRHIAVVRDEWGGTEGIITLEDILEELVGELYDESEDVKLPIRQTSKANVFLVLGTINIADFFERFHLDEDLIADDYSTLSGWVVDRLGRFAREGDSFSFGSIDVTVTKATKYTVEEVRVDSHPVAHREEYD